MMKKLKNVIPAKIHRQPHANSHGKRSADDLKVWIEKMRATGLKLTPTRSAILQCLIGSHELLSIEDLVKQIKEQGLLGEETCDYTTVYRCLLKFEEAGLLVSTNFGDGISRFELKGDHHHHHVVCKTCKQVRAIDDCGFKALDTAIHKLGYSNVVHRLEFFGICPACQKT
jgi:Fur family transcriptional regulator, ferric uptake regulator